MDLDINGMHLFISGRTAGASGFSMVYLVTAEVYPTNLRAQAVGTCSMVARTFGLCAGFVGRLATVWTPLPMLVLGVPSLVAAALALTLTETSGVDLPQNMAQAEKMDKSGRKWPNFMAAFQGRREKQIIKTPVGIYKE
jgi:OCT family organic cation transporter-like MFS transporter 4/5